MEGVGRQVYAVSGDGTHVKKMKHHIVLGIELQWGKYFIKEFKEGFFEVVIPEHRPEWNG